MTHDTRQDAFKAMLGAPKSRAEATDDAVKQILLDEAEHRRALTRGLRDARLERERRARSGKSPKSS